MDKFRRPALLAFMFAAAAMAHAETNDCTGDNTAYKCIVNLDKSRPVRIDATGAMRSQGAERPTGQLVVTVNGTPCKGGDTGKRDWETGVKADFLATCTEPFEAGKRYEVVVTPASDKAEVTSLMLKVE
jgi:hypothetical protein